MCFPGSVPMRFQRANECTGQTTLDRIHRCEICFATFTTKGGLVRHTDGVHLNKHRHRCSICGRGFSVTELFHDHLNMHNNIKAHSCPHCGKDYTYKSSLRQHLREGHCSQCKD
ncbi:hypothetical protein V1264_013866 [Littorina saxatilis]|uniref:C2H2-type domain-containing protein n=1 Tax=Littorina saxatilis TaxID=31220 RepID=A0AAN9GIA8_9CAEN